MGKLEFARQYGQWALVTGASSGLGREMAVQLATRGLNILASGRDRERLDETAAMIRTTGHEVRTVVADIARDAGRHALIEASRGLEIGLLVPAAGFGAGGAFLESQAGEMREMLMLNCACVGELVLHLAPPMAARGRGGILLVASLLAFHGVPYAAHYAATKAYVQSFGEALSVELAASGVDVLVSSPGPTATGFGARARMRLDRAMDSRDVARASIAALGRSATLLPGGLTKILHGALAALPRGAKVRMMGRIMKGMT